MAAKSYEVSYRKSSELDVMRAIFLCAKMPPKIREEFPFWGGIKMQLLSAASSTKLWKLLCLFGAGFLFLATQADALDPKRLISQYGHTVWRPQDGFAGLFLTQTADGYIQLAGSGHFIRFDGTQFATWLQPKGPSFGRSGSSIFGSHDGALWIAGSAGLGRIKDGKISIFPNSTDRAGINNIIEDHTGRIWVTRYHVPEGKGAICEVVDDWSRCYGPSDGVPAPPSYGISGIAEDRAGNLWFGGATLYRWKPGTKATQYLDGFKHPEILDVAVDHSGDVWVVMDGVGPHFGVQYLHNGVWGEYSTAGFHSSTLKANNLFVDRDGAVWIATEDDGLYRVSKGTADHFSKADGLSGRKVYQIMEDREGNIWVLTDGGMDMFRNLVATDYSLDQGLSSGSPSSVFVSSDGVVWAGAYNGAQEWNSERSADILRPPDLRFAPGPKFPGRIQSMFQDHSGALWMGLSNNLAVYEHGNVEKVLDRNGQVLRLDSTPAILEDPTHTILALSQTHLFLIRGRRLLKEMSLPQRLPNLGLLITDPDGGTIIAGRGQLMRYKSGALENYSLPNGEKSAGVMDVIADPDDPLLLATLDGLLRWDGKRWHPFNEDNGLPCNHLLSFIKDRHGSLWLHSVCGLLKVEASELQRWRRDEERQPKVKVFDVSDGVQIGRFYSIQPVMSLAPDGRVWFSNGRTIQSFDPDQTYENLIPPPVHVERLIADGKPYQIAGQPHIPPNPRDLEIDYTGLSFSVPKKVQFRYFLEGHDKTWQGPVTRRHAFYTDLPPGTYRFHVTACNNSGVWSNMGAVAEFVVQPAFYQTWWFRAGLTIIAAGLLWGLYLLRLKQATATAQDRILTQVQERDRIARDLHDTLLQGFQGIALQVQGVAKKLNVQDPLRKTMEEVLDRADETLSEARQRVRKLRQRTTEEDELPKLIEKCGRELSQDHTANFCLTIIGAQRPLESAVQDEAYDIAVESLRNAFRHASASRMEVEILYDASFLRIRVRDDGVGIEEGLLVNGRPGHWGLIGMHERAKAIRAELKIWSRPGTGTEVELVIPAALAFPRNNLQFS